jgi:hypothetical protein
MRAKLKNSYKKAGNNGTVQTIFVYRVNGTEEQLEKYQELREAEGYYTEDEDGTPLYFTNRYYGDNINLMVTTNDNIVVDTTIFDKVQSLADNNPFMREQLAAQMAAQLLGSMSNSTNSTVNKKVEEQKEEDLDV